MSSYQKSLVLCSLLILLTGCSTKEEISIENKEPVKTFINVKTKSFDLEDFYIMYALEAENQRMYFNARDIYLKLFENTNNYDYLVKYLTITTQLKEYFLVKENASKYMLENIKQEEIILRLYAFALFKLGENKEAIFNAEKLIFSYKNANNYELLGSIYLEDKQYLKSYEAFNNAFLLNSSPNTLMTLATIQFVNLNEKEEAIKKLENYIYKNDYNFPLCMQLLAFYDEIKAQDRLVSFLKNMYLYYKKSENQLLVNKTKALFLKYVVNNDIKTVIQFWEQNGEEDEILLNLYRMTNESIKAYNLLNKFYKETNNLDYLAQLAILEFEIAGDKKLVMSGVINKFEKVLQTLDNPIYQNYLAYILIDYDLNIKRGLYLVKKALEKDPTNIAFLDTLAWGEYKDKNCEEAFSTMKQIVDEIGLDDDEIKNHWEKIKECK